MSTSRKFLVVAGWVCIAVIIEGGISGARHAVAKEPAAIVALMRVLLAWWIGASIAATLKESPE